MSTISSRPLPYLFTLGIPLLLIALLLLGTEYIDFTLADLFYQPGKGFIGPHSGLLEDWLHDRAKQAVIVLCAIILVSWLISLVYQPWHRYRRVLSFMVLSLSLTSSIVTPLKALTAVQCPWDLEQYGGSETYTPLLSERAATLKPGRCWPGGHASSGFSLFVLYFAWRDRKPRVARAFFIGALSLGAVFSVGRMLQGAHFLSHNLWTALFDWLICLGCYYLILYRPEQEVALSATQQPPAPLHCTHNQY